MSERTRGLRGLAVLAGAAIIALLAASGTAAASSSPGTQSAAQMHPNAHTASIHAHATQTQPIAATGEASAAATHYAVVLSEMSITTTWTAVAAGPVVFDVRNAGTVTHELVVIRTDLPPASLPKDPANASKVLEDGAVGEADDIAPGTSATLALTLDPGHYVLICNEPGHYAAGMHTGFTAATFVGVVLKEMSISLDRSAVPFGPVVFDVQNVGSVTHELVLLRTGLPADLIPLDKDRRADERWNIGEIDDVSPGKSAEGVFDLLAGNYVLVCNEPGHYLAGMRTSLTVAPSLVTITLNEMAIKLDKIIVPRGPVTFGLSNIGTVTHEFVVIRTDTAEGKLPNDPSAAGKVIEDGSVGEADDIPAVHGFSGLGLSLSPGHYVVICNEPGHYAAGMHAALTVQ